MVDQVKRAFWSDINAQAESLISGETNWVTNLSNLASLLWHELREPTTQDLPGRDINWSGFYLVDTKKPTDLILGPFQGKVACVRIPVGKGVCGVSAKDRKSQLVHDVHEFPGHIACDSASNSEVVIPLIKGNKVIGVIDIDCETINGFDQLDIEGLENLANHIIAQSDFEDILASIE